MSNFIVPNTFIPGTKAKAQEVNENFTAIQDELSLKATKSGDSSQTFNVAEATESFHAVSKTQAETLINASLDEIKKDINKGQTPLFAISGNIDENGEAKIIINSGLTLSFLVGSSYPKIKAIIDDLEVEIENIEEVSLSGYQDGTYNIFVDKDGEISLFANNIYIQPKVPTLLLNDIWVDTSTGQVKVYQYNGSENIEFKKIFLGTVTLANSAITTVFNVPFCYKKVTQPNNTKPATIVEYYQNGTNWYRLWSDGWLEQGGTFSAYGNVSVTFLKPYKSSVYPFVSWQYGSTNWDKPIYFNYKNLTGIVIYVYSGVSSEKFWYACGY